MAWREGSKKALQGFRYSNNSASFLSRGEVGTQCAALVIHRSAHFSSHHSWSCSGSCSRIHSCQNMKFSQPGRCRYNSSWCSKNTCIRSIRSPFSVALSSSCVAIRNLRQVLERHRCTSQTMWSYQCLLLLALYLLIKLTMATIQLKRIPNLFSYSIRSNSLYYIPSNLRLWCCEYSQISHVSVSCRYLKHILFIC